MTCDECNVILKDFPSLTAHKKEEHAAKQFYCHECDYGSNLYTELWKHRFMTHDVSKGQDMDPAEMFMNVIAAQQDFIVNQLEKTEKRWEAEFKGIHVNQNKLFDEIKALNKTVSKNQNVPKELIKETMENITTKAEDVLRSFQREMRKENVGSASTKEQKKKLLFVGDSLSRNLNVSVIKNVTDMDVKRAEAFAVAKDDPKARFPDTKLY